MSYLEGIQIDYETADMITRLTLIESLKGINKDIDPLEDRNNMSGESVSYLEDFEKEDLKNNLKYREALLVVIEYFSTEEQMKEVISPPQKGDSPLCQLTSTEQTCPP